MAKNKMRRCLMAILDPHPTSAELSQLWSHFDSSCAYCGASLDRHARVGHLDHVLPSALGGNNSIYNHVLSCARCNGDEKREGSWQVFLAKKVPDATVAAARYARIEAWLSLATSSSAFASETQKEAETIIQQALASFDAAVSKIRALRESGI